MEKNNITLLVNIKSFKKYVRNLYPHVYRAKEPQQLMEVLWRFGLFLSEACKKIVKQKSNS